MLPENGGLYYCEVHNYWKHIKETVFIPHSRRAKITQVGTLTVRS